MTWNIPFSGAEEIPAGTEIRMGPATYVSVTDSKASSVACVLLDSVAPHRRRLWCALAPRLPMSMRGALARWALVEWRIQWPL